MQSTYLISKALIAAKSSQKICFKVSSSVKHSKPIQTFSVFSLYVLSFQLETAYWRQKLTMYIISSQFMSYSNSLFTRAISIHLSDTETQLGNR